MVKVRSTLTATFKYMIQYHYLQSPYKIISTQKLPFARLHSGTKFSFSRMRRFQRHFVPFPSWVVMILSVSWMWQEDSSCLLTTMLKRPFGFNQEALTNCFLWIWKDFPMESDTFSTTRKGRGPRDPVIIPEIEITRIKYTQAPILCVTTRIYRGHTLQTSQWPWKHLSDKFAGDVIDNDSSAGRKPTWRPASQPHPTSQASQTLVSPYCINTQETLLSPSENMAGR